MKLFNAVSLAAILVSSIANAGWDDGTPKWECQIIASTHSGGSEVDRVLARNRIPLHQDEFGNSLLGGVEYRDSEIYVTAAINVESDAQGRFLQVFIAGISPEGEGAHVNLAAAQFDRFSDRIQVETNAPVASYGKLKLKCWVE